MTSRNILSDNQREQLRRLVDTVRFDEPMSRHCTLKIGGPADAWVAPTSVDSLVAVVRYCIAESLPQIAIGGGSNVLIRDGGIRGVVLSTRALRGIKQVADVEIAVQSGVSTGKLLSSATRWELGGVEFLGGVPGSVGGGLVMNAGTYLGEFKDVVQTVRSLHLHTGALISRTLQECGFGYRTSRLPVDEIVVDATLQLCARPKSDITTTVKQLRARRKEREPKGASNAGSVFKNPPNDFAGRLIESVNFKGTRVGQAECSTVHANWFVNLGGATANDMLCLIATARDKVAADCGIELQLEWKCIGED